MTWEPVWQLLYDIFQSINLKYCLIFRIWFEKQKFDSNIYFLTWKSKFISKIQSQLKNLASTQNGSKIEIRPGNWGFLFWWELKNGLPLIRSWQHVCPKYLDFATVWGLGISYKTHSSFFQAWAFLFPPHVTFVLKTLIGSKYVLSTSSKRIGSSFSSFFQHELTKI